MGKQWQNLSLEEGSKIRMNKLSLKNFCISSISFASAMHLQVHAIRIHRLTDVLFTKVLPKPVLTQSPSTKEASSLTLSLSIASGSRLFSA